MLDAILFDIDGTLVDSNEVHVTAWAAALRDANHAMGPELIRREIGKGGDRVVIDLLGDSIEAEEGDALRVAHERVFEELALGRGLKPAPAAESLLLELRRRGIKSALATSSNQRGIAIVERASGLALSRLVDAIASKGDLERSTSGAELLHVAINRLGVAPPQCALVGDTRWDGECARRAGLVFLGVTFGGNSEKTLRRTGARRVFADAADLLANLDDALSLASPAAVRLDHPTSSALMRDALAIATEGLVHGEVPIGSVLAQGDGTIVSRGHNEFNRTRDPTAHAEMQVLRAAAGRIQAGARDLILVSTLEPCVMCLGAAMEIGIDTILYGLRAPCDGGTSRVAPPESPDNQVTRVWGGVLATESRALFERWLQEPSRNRHQEPYVRQLLALV